MRLRSGSKFAIAVLALFAAVWGGWFGYAKIRLAGFELKPMSPSVVNLVAMAPGTGYRIIVANQVAQLAEAKSGGGPGSEGAQADDEAQVDASTAKKLPIRELLGSLRGDPESMGAFVMALNNLNEEDLPARRVIWKAEDLQRALQGDQELAKKLVQDLHVELDGTPLRTLRMSALMNGIVIDAPVEVKTTVDGQPRTVVGRVLDPYTPQFARAVQNRLGKQFNPPVEVVLGTYRDEANRVFSGAAPKENVRVSLTNRISPTRLAKLAKEPERLLAAFTVLLTENQIKSASYTTEETRQGPVFNLKLMLDDLGRMRLWKYSNAHPNFQLLLISNDVAIAAPRITNELRSHEVRITQLPNEKLLDRMIESLKVQP